MGHPNKVDDALFIPEEHKECDGEVVWEGGSPHWTCRKCGYVGWATVTTHYPVIPPKVLFNWCKNYLRILRMRSSSYTKTEADNQTYFIAAVALQRAALKKPEEIKSFIAALERL